MTKTTLGFQAGENAGDLETYTFGGDETRNPKTVLGITKATTSGQKQKEHGEAPGCPGGGQNPKTSWDVENGN